MTRTQPVVAIDGPAGAGKSTVSRRVADALGYLLLDTGALYRCVALCAQRCAATDSEKIGLLAQKMADECVISFRNLGSGQQAVFIGNEDVSQAIRTGEISQGASRVSAIPAVRAALLDMQRAAGRGGAVVVEGRDIGTVVFPDAEAKFFLTASVAARAGRRHAELLARSPDAPDFQTVMKEVEERDQRDSSRDVAPLIQAPDAVLVDSTAMTIDQVVNFIVQRVPRSST